MFDLKKLLEDAVNGLGETVGLRQRPQPGSTAKPAPKPVQKPQGNFFTDTANNLGQGAKNLSDFSKTLTAGIQQGAGSVGDVALQAGSAIANPIVKALNPDIAQYVDQATVDYTEPLRQNVHNLKDAEGKNIIGTTNVDQNAANIANGRGNVQDYSAVLGKGLEAANTATMLANPVTIARGLPVAQAVKLGAKDAALFGTTGGLQGGLQTYGATGDLGQAVKQGATSALLSGATQGALDIVAPVIGSVIRNTPKATTKLVNTAIDAVPTAQKLTDAHPEILQLKDTGTQLFEQRQGLINRGATEYSPAVRQIDNAIKNLGQEYNATYQRVMAQSKNQLQRGSIQIPGGKDNILPPENITKNIQDGDKIDVNGKTYTYKSEIGLLGNKEEFLYPEKAYEDYLVINRDGNKTSINSIYEGEKPIYKFDNSKETPKLTEEQYLSQNRAGFMDGAEPALHQNKIRTKRGQSNVVEGVMDNMGNNNIRRQELRQEYQQKVSTGDIAQPTRIEQLVEKANGLPELQSTQAARRLLDKQGVSWKGQPQDLPIIGQNLNQRTVETPEINQSLIPEQPVNIAPPKQTKQSAKPSVSENDIQKASSYLDNTPQLEIVNGKYVSPITGEPVEGLSPPIAREAPRGTQLPTINTKKVSNLDKIFRSTRSVIERQGEKGKELGTLLQKSRDDEELFQASLLKEMPTVPKLKDKEFENFVDATQGNAKPLNDKVVKAVAEWQAVHPQIRQRAVDSGLDVGDLGPNYYPHFIDYDRVFKDKNTFNEAINHLVKTGQAKNQQEAIKLLGYARDVSRNRAFGNLESSRLVDLPFYDKTNNSFRQYLQSSSRRIAQTENFGAKDEKALDLITKAGNEGYDTEAMKNAYDVAVGAKKYNQSTEKASRNVRRYITTTRLGLGALTNTSQSVNTGIVTGHLRTLNSMIKQLDPKQREFVHDTGVIADTIINDLRAQQGFESFGKSTLGKAINAVTAPGFGAVEKFNRGVAAVAGRDYGLRLAQQGKDDVLRRLGVTGDIKNNTLTKAQQVQIARKVVEKTQFKVDPQDLPGWTDSPGGKLVSQFRTFSYNQAKFFSNEVLKPVAKGNILPLTRVLAALPLGYALYETRRAIDGRPEEEDKFKVGLESFSKIGGAGLALDIYRGINPVNGNYIPPDRRVSMAAGTIGGPAVGQAINLVGGLSEALQHKNVPDSNPDLEGKVAVKNLEDGKYNDLTSLTRQAIQQVPIVGTPLANRLIPYTKQSEDKSVATPGQTEPTITEKDGKFKATVDGSVNTYKTKKAAEKAIKSDDFKKSDENIRVDGDTVYRKDADGDVTTIPKIKYDYQLNTATLEKQKKADDLDGWMTTAESQLNNIYKQLEDKNIDPLDAIKLQSDADDLLALAQKYGGYKGFTKPKKGKSGKKGGKYDYSKRLETATSQQQSVDGALRKLVYGSKITRKKIG